MYTLRPTKWWLILNIHRVPVQFIQHGCWIPQLNLTWKLPTHLGMILRFVLHKSHWLRWCASVHRKRTLIMMWPDGFWYRSNFSELLSHNMWWTEVMAYQYRFRSGLNIIGIRCFNHHKPYHKAMLSFYVYWKVLTSPSLIYITTL